jgi:hypothetical protein
MQDEVRERFRFGTLAPSLALDLFPGESAHRLPSGFARAQQQFPCSGVVHFDCINRSRQIVQRKTALEVASLGLNHPNSGGGGGGGGGGDGGDGGVD